MLTTRTIISRSDGITHRRLAGERGGVLLALGTGAYHSVNGLGMQIWELLERPMTLGGLSAAVAGQLHDAPAELAADVAGFVQGLSERDLVELSG